MSSSGAVVPFVPKSKSRVSPDKEGITSVIARTCTFEGTLNLKEGIKIDGKIAGDVVIESADGCLCILDAGGVIDGSLQAPRAWIAGHIRGGVCVGELKLFPQARIDGDIVYERLLVAEGAEINGRMMKKVEHEAAAEVPVADDLHSPATPEHQVGEDTVFPVARAA